MTGAGQDRLSFDVDDRSVGHLTLDLPDRSVNVLGTDLVSDLEAVLDEAERRAADDTLSALVVRSGKDDSFIAGADIEEIAGLSSREEAREKSRRGQLLFSRLADLPVPTVALIRGTCLGGGTELALACDHRLASDRDSTEIGLPEVKLGILPGFGGTVRLPRLVGIQNALDLILTGSSASPGKAGHIGLVDRVVADGRWEREVDEFLDEVLAGDVGPSGYRKSWWEKVLEDTAPGRKLLFAIARRRTEERAGEHYPAPLRALEVVERTYPLDLDRALEIEADALAELALTPESKNLVRVFLLSRSAKEALPEEQRDAAREVEKAAVLGAGVMGGEIAEVMVAKDLPVLLKDIREDALDEALEHARGLLEKGRRKGVFEEHEVGLKFARIEPTLEYDGFGDVDLVVEAVVEEMDVKQQVLSEAEESLPDHAVFTTNTSSLSVTELASAADRPEQVAGLHFFNPAHKMPLVEVVRGEETSDETLATAFEFARDLGKTPVIVADEPGFLVNRLLAPYMNEAVRLLEEGAGVEALDRAISDFGMPMGPCRLLDEVGLDIARHVREQLESGFGERMEAPDLVDRLAEDGRLGKKNGRGFYRYEDGELEEVDPELQRRLESIRGRDREMPPETMRRRCLYPMVNEAAFALGEDVARSADDVDLALVMGTGFPPFRGGLLRWADSVGVGKIHSWLSNAADRLGPRYEPAPLVEELARDDGRFTGSG